MSWQKFALFFLTILLGAVPAAAQNHEIAILGGGHFPVNSSIGTSPGFALQGNYAGRIAGVPLIALYLEVPVVASFRVDLDSIGLPEPTDYSALFVTPGLKLKFASAFPVSPFVSFGGGLARFKQSETLSDGSPNPDPTRNTGVFAIGGGADFKAAPFISLRAEVRDFYSGRPRLTLADVGERQHNVVVSGGIVLRF